MRGLGDLIFNSKPNEDMKKAAKLSSDLIGEASKSVKIVSGCLPHEFYESNGVGAAIKNKLNSSNGLEVEIISGPNIDTKSKIILELVKNNKIKLFISKDYPAKHFLLTDHKNVRAEFNHKATDLDLVKTKGTVIKNTIFLGKKLAIEFENMKADSDELKSNSKILAKI